MEFLANTMPHETYILNSNCVEFITVTAERQWSTIEPLESLHPPSGWARLNFKCPTISSHSLPVFWGVIYGLGWVCQAYRNVLASAVILLRPVLTHACHVITVLICTCV